MGRHRVSLISDWVVAASSRRRIVGECCAGTVVVMPEIDSQTVTRAAYDTVASDYARLFKDALDRMPWDRAVLAVFAESVLQDRLGGVADVGCGPGRITGYLHQLGLDAFGVDLSPGMLALARHSLPGLRFVEGSMAALDLLDASLGGVVAWYSLIHIPPPDITAVLSEFCRVLPDAARPARAATAGRWPARTRPRCAGPRRPGDRAAGLPARPQDLRRPLLTALRDRRLSATCRLGIPCGTALPG